MSTTERAGGLSPRWRDTGEPRDDSYRRPGNQPSAREELDAERRQRMLERVVAGVGVLIFGMTAVYLLTVYWQLVLFMALGAVGLGLVWWSRRPEEPAPITVEAHVALPPIPPPTPAPLLRADGPASDLVDRAEPLGGEWQLTLEALAGTACVDLSSRDGTDRDGRLDVLSGLDRQAALAEVSSVAPGVVRRRDVVAVLRPEPGNRFDRNAVRVEVFGRLVGYLARDDAGVVASLLLDLQRGGHLVATVAEITGHLGRTADESSLGIALQIRPLSEWEAAFTDPQNVRSIEPAA